MFLINNILYLWLLFLTACCVVYCQDEEGKALNKEGKLYHDLYRHLINESEYEVNLRLATESDPNPTKLQFGLTLMQLFGIDEEKQTIELQVIINKVWNDPRLKWNPSDYEGISQIKIPNDKIWRPDFVLFNGAFETGEGSGLGQNYDALAVVQSTGTVTWYPVARIKAMCEIDMSDFPFDKQKCQLKFGSWSHSLKEVEPTFVNGLPDFEKSYYTHTNVWELTKTYAERHDSKYAGSQDLYSDMTFYMELSRKRTYYSYMLFLPALIMVWLLPVMFLLPVGRSEKINVGCSLLICLTLLSLLLQMMVPTAHNGVPFIQAYCMGNFIVTGISLAISATILNISRFTSRPPACLTRIIAVCAKCCCLSLPTSNYNSFDGGEDVSIVKSTYGLITDWTIVATVLDRFFLFCSIFVAIVLTLGMLAHM